MLSRTDPSDGLYLRNHGARWIYLAEFLLAKGYEVHGIIRRTFHF